MDWFEEWLKEGEEIDKRQEEWKAIIGHALKGELEKAHEVLDSLPQKDREWFLDAFEWTLKFLVYRDVKGRPPILSQQEWDNLLDFLYQAKTKGMESQQEP
jgi:hypothetical protein